MTNPSNAEISDPYQTHGDLRLDSEPPDSRSGARQSPAALEDDPEPRSTRARRSDRVRRWTDLTVRAIPLSKPGQRRYESDPNFPGLKLRISDQARVWYVVAWSSQHGRVMRVKLGAFPALSLADARHDARDVVAAITHGLDPNQEKRRAQAEAETAKAAEERADASVFSAVAEQFLERADVGDRWRVEQRRLLARHIPLDWRSRSIATITRREVRELVESIAKRTPVLANRLLATLQKLYSWAVERELVDAHPLTHLKPSVEKSRERVLSDAELLAVWQACDSYPWGALLRFSLATAARRGECAGAKWTDINFAERLWTIPKSKSGHAHEIPLSPLAVEILKGCKRGEYVFASKAGTMLTDFSDAITAIKKRVPVTNWRVHDLRRSAATGMARLGVPKETIKRVLGHSERDVTEIYVRHGWLKEKAAALDLWSRHLRRVIGRKDRAK
jgi:integrase